MSVWVCIPSKRAPADAQPIINTWDHRGYKVIVQRDIGDDPLTECLCVHREYAGFAEAQNYLIRNVMDIDADAEWFVCAGDDIFPEMMATESEIAAECCSHFAGTFGVMQPTGDRWGEGDRADKAQAHIDCIAGSPWIGREYARLMYGGKGPYWQEYYHMFEDEEMQCVAELMGVFWQRRDVTQIHRHWTRAEAGYNSREHMPAFLGYANSRENWNKSKAIFNARKAAGFPGHEPIL